MRSRSDGLGDTSNGFGDVSDGLGDTNGGLGDTDNGLGDTDNGLGDTNIGLGNTNNGLGDTNCGLGDEWRTGSQGEAISSSSSMATLRRIIEVEEWRKSSKQLEEKIKGINGHLEGGNLPVQPL